MWIRTQRRHVPSLEPAGTGTKPLPSHKAGLQKVFWHLGLPYYMYLPGKYTAYGNTSSLFHEQ